MIKSEIYKGLIYAGSTQLDSSLTFEQTGPMEITISAGRFVTTGGIEVVLIEPQPVSFEVNAVDTHYAVELGLLNGEPQLLLLEHLEGYADAEYPEGWQHIQLLVLPFRIATDATELPDVYVFTVLPGFPDGTGPEDWAVQMGVTNA